MYTDDVAHWSQNVTLVFILGSSCNTPYSEYYRALFVTLRVGRLLRSVHLTDEKMTFLVTVTVTLTTARIDGMPDPVEPTWPL